MKSRFPGAIALILASIVGILVSCGGGSTTVDQILEDFDLTITANPNSGSAPLTVSFFAVPSGGIAPYTYEWNFNSSLGGVTDDVIDSNASSGVYTYNESGVATVLVTDNDGQQVLASLTVIVVPDAGTPEPDAMTVSFSVNPPAGNVPFGAQFATTITGGIAPYTYTWDFDGDGVTDSFKKDPYWIFEQIGNETEPGSGTYETFPVVVVTDSQGVTATNFDDNNHDGEQDGVFAVTVNPTLGELVAVANANPLTGQAPLTVEFTGATANGTGNYVYSWEFGEGAATEFKRTSVATHTYLSAGEYKARVTVYDLKEGTLEPDIQQPRPMDLITQDTSEWITIKPIIPQALSLTITSDIVSGQVPFSVNFEANIVNGTEPIQYHWDIFSDTTPTDDEPSIATPPWLDSGAVITPKFTFRKNPSVHFANVTDEGSYVARCVAQDAAGNTVVSENMIRIIATPNTSYPYYLANRPEVVSQTFFPISRGGTSAQADVDPAAPGPPMNPRANPAIASHPTGLTFIIGGEILDENGIFEDLVSRGDSMFMYVPEPGGTHSGQTNIGKFSTAEYGGGVIRLNDSSSPSFPGPAGDAPTIPAGENGLRPEGYPGPGPLATNRSTSFTIVGSAAAVYIHEQGGVETNPDGAYEAARNGPKAADWQYPDCPTLGWGLDAPTGNTDGLGVPVIFVLGGRTDATTPTDLVQKYYPFGFGTEDLYSQSIEFSFQTTGNQTDTWSTYFLRPDQDQFPDSEAGPPDVSQRSGSGGGDDEMPTLPVAAYGLMAVAMESGVQVGAAAFPGQPFKYIFTFGGIDKPEAAPGEPDQPGSVLRDMRRWDTSLGAEQGGGNDEEEEGVFSLVPIEFEGNLPAFLPTARAYGQAVLLPGSELQIALVGGVTNQGVPLDTIDIFTFTNANNPTYGEWETFEGTLPETLEALGAGYLPGPGGQKWIMAFGGWTGEDFNSDVYSIRVNSPGNLVVNQGLSLAPRSGIGSGQGGSVPIANLMAGIGIDLTFNRFVMVAGVDENGTDSVIEVFSLP